MLTRRVMLQAMCRGMTMAVGRRRAAGGREVKRRRCRELTAYTGLEVRVSYCLATNKQ